MRINGLKSLLFLVIILALSACSKDLGTVKPPTKGAFNDRAFVEPGDDYTEKDADAVPTGLASDKNLNVWACGNIKAKDQPSHAIVRVSAKAGDINTWSTTSDTQGPTNEGASNSSVTTDGSGNVFVAQTYKSGNLTVASILFSKDNGVNWKNADYATPNQSGVLKTAVIGANGLPYFVGYSEDQNKTKHSFVLSLQNDVATLVAINDLAEMNTVSVSTSGDYLVFGTTSSADTTKGPSIWSLLTGRDDRSPLEYLELTNATPRKLSNPIYGSGESVIVNQIGMFVGGKNKDSEWVIKRSTDGGNNFGDSDNFKANHLTKTYLSSLYDFNGVPVAVGGAEDVQKRSHWVVRTADTIGRWRNLFSNAQAVDADISAKAVAATAVMNNKQLLVLGKSHDHATGYHWRLMKVTEKNFFPDRH